MKALRLGGWLLLGSVLWACDAKDNEVAPEASFYRVYDDGTYGLQAHALDLVETADGGFLMLGTRDVWDIYLVKADKQGALEWELRVSDPYVSPTPELLEINGEIYVVAMRETSTEAVLLRVDMGAQNLVEVQNFDDTEYPLAAAVMPDNGLLLLLYESGPRRSGLVRTNAAFDTLWDDSYPIFEDVEGQIIGHLRRTGPRYPFTCGINAAQNRVYFNGFYNYTLAMLFANSADGALSGSTSGSQYVEGFSDVLPLASGQYAVARFDQLSSYYVPDATLNENGIDLAISFPGPLQPEIERFERVRIEQLNLGGREVVAYGSSTRGGQIVVNFYGVGSPGIIGNLRLGSGDPLELGGMAATADGGLAVLGRVSLQGRFPRLCLYKLSKEEVDELF